jgi:hypothetical protein
VATVRTPGACSEREDRAHALADVVAEVEADAAALDVELELELEPHPVRSRAPRMDRHAAGRRMVRRKG